MMAPYSLFFVYMYSVEKSCKGSAVRGGGVGHEQAILNNEHPN